jgi:hypothetical protein
MADLCAADTARADAVTRKTHEDHDRTWLRWKSYLDSVGLIDDYFLDSFNRTQRIRLVGAFMQALRQGRFSGPSYETLAGTTIDNALSSLVQTFRDNDRPNPTLDADGKLGRLLQQQKRAYANKDPAPKQQKALPCVVLKELARMEATEKSKRLLPNWPSAPFSSPVDLVT